MRITIKELRQLVRSVISENLRFDGNEYSYDEGDDESFTIEFELNGNDFEVDGKDYGGDDIDIDSIIINGTIDGMESIRGEYGEHLGRVQEKYSGLDYGDFKYYVIDELDKKFPSR